MSAWLAVPLSSLLAALLAWFEFRRADSLAKRQKLVRAWPEIADLSVSERTSQALDRLAGRRIRAGAVGFWAGCTIGASAVALTPVSGTGAGFLLGTSGCLGLQVGAALAGWRRDPPAQDGIALSALQPRDLVDWTGRRERLGLLLCGTGAAALLMVSVGLLVSDRDHRAATAGIVFALLVETVLAACWLGVRSLLRAPIRATDQDTLAAEDVRIGLSIHDLVRLVPTATMVCLLAYLSVVDDSIGGFVFVGLVGGGVFLLLFHRDLNPPLFPVARRVTQEGGVPR